MTTATKPLPKRIPGAALDQALRAVSTDEPMTAERLAEISAAYAAATAGPWYFETQYGPYFLASEVRGYMHGIGQLEFGEGKAADRDRAFVLNSHAYVAELLDEVERLRGALFEQSANEYCELFSWETREWTCNQCGHVLADHEHCPDHAPTHFPGLRRLECDAEPGMHPEVFMYADNEPGYGPICFYCVHAVSDTSGRWSS